ncbi:MAG: HlyD family efflux transporter periplasmic adaptor subunit [Rhodospirillaceae bacterium]|nr:HlyD family efflux transporter periplasmic adaptor subunit [Rhodospirillaceae bacterium]
MADNHQQSISYAKRRMVWGGAAALLGLFLVWAFWPAAILVDVEKITKGEIKIYVEANGRTRVKDVYQISAPVSGRVLRIETDAGDKVVSGVTVLSVIEPAEPTFLDARSRAEAEAAVEAAVDAQSQAAAALDQARAQLKFFKGELDRSRQLANDGTISKRALEKSELDWETQTALVKSAEATYKVRSHELQTANARLISPNARHRGNGDCCIEIKSPINGTVLRVLQESAGVVAAGTPLLEVGNPEEIEVVVDLLTVDAIRIREGAEVKIENWGGESLVGTVRMIEPYGYTKVSVLGIEEQRIDVVIDFLQGTKLPVGLGHGFRVEASILEWKGADVVRVPVSALFRTGNEWAVYVNDNGTARLQKVSIGHINNVVAEAVSGLTSGEMVIVHPGDKVKDGIRVSPRGK